MPAQGGQLIATQRPLNATAFCHTALTGVPAGISGMLTLQPLVRPGEWAGEVTIDDITIDLAVFKNPGDDLYQIELYLWDDITLLADFVWYDQKPKADDPLAFADLGFKDPLTGSQTTVTILS